MYLCTNCIVEGKRDLAYSRWQRAVLERLPNMASRGSANLLAVPVCAVGLDRLQHLHLRVSRLAITPAPFQVPVQHIQCIQLARYDLDATVWLGEWIFSIGFD